MAGFAEVAVEQAERFCYAATVVMPHTIREQQVTTLQRSFPLATYYGQVAEGDFNARRSKEGLGRPELIQEICADPEKNFEYVPRTDQVFFSGECRSFLASLMTEGAGCPALKVQLGEDSKRIRFFQFLWQTSVKDFVDQGFAVRFATI